MDFPTLNVFLSLILTVASVWNTGETGDMNTRKKLILIAMNAFGQSNFPGKVCREIM